MLPELRVGRAACAASIPIEIAGPITVTDDEILVQEKKGQLTCRDRDGNVVWSTAVGTLAQAPTAAANLIVLATTASPNDGKPAVLALDRRTGLLLWRAPLDSEPITSPCLEPVGHLHQDRGKSIFYLGTRLRLEARSLANGQVLKDWQCQGGPPSAEFALLNEDLIYVSTGGELTIIERGTGTVKSRRQGALPGFPPLPSRTRAVVMTERGLSLASLEKLDAKLQPWIETKEAGPFLAPAVLSDSRASSCSRKLLA